MQPEPSSRREFLAALTALGLAGIDSQAADQPRTLEPTGANLGSLFPEVEKLATANRYQFSFLGDPFKTLDEFKKTAREKLFDVLLYRPQPVEPKAEVVEREDLGDFVREKVLFNTSPLFRVPAYIHIPKKVKTPAPAIVDLHSHGGMFIFGKEKVIDLGKANHPAIVQYHERNYDGRPTTNELVRRGYVVISIDAFMFGERRILMDADLKYGYDRSKYSLEDVKYLNGKCRGKEDTIVKGLCYAGLTWPGIVFWDDIRTVDYLVSRPEVDPQRIGCLGISMGGWRTAFLAGLDERIAAACVVGFMSTMKPMIKAHLDTHSFVHFVPGLHRWLDLPDVVSMLAPKPLLVQQCSKDGLFPLAGMKESVDKLAAIYDKAGVKSKFDGRFYDEPHKFTRAMQDEAFDWFDKHLKG
jgi:dienelactone hydrolase